MKMKFKEQSFTLFAYTNYRAIQGSHSSNHRILSEKVRSTIPLYNRGWVCFCWTIVPCGVRGFDVKEIRVNWGMRLNGAVCECWA